MSKSRIWRVDVSHIAGYHAPSQLIETEEDRLWKAQASALAQAKENNRLADFPQKWEFTATLLDKVQLNGKWYDADIYSLKTGLVRVDGKWQKPQN